ncbi:MAG: hypothetical protein AAF984_11240, partial [Verrucomicrobiota bacterium]
MKIFLLCLVMWGGELLLSSSPVHAQSWASRTKKVTFNQDKRIASLEEQLEKEKGKGKVTRPLSVTMLLFLYGAFAALWAQNTGRSVRKWFMLGLGLNMLTLLYILIVNGREKESEKLRNAPTIATSKSI